MTFPLLTYPSLVPQLVDVPEQYTSLFSLCFAHMPYSCIIATAWYIEQQYKYSVDSQVTNMNFHNLTDQ